MTFPLIYLHGGYGWMPGLKHQSGKSKISLLQFCNYGVSCKNGFNPQLNFGNVSTGSGRRVC